MRKLLKSKKGFTLVEIIVVLVILAILAAFLVPALTGYIDKANDKAVIAEARSVLMAAQTLASEAYAGGTDDAIVWDDAKTLAEVPGTISAGSIVGGKVSAFTYANSVKTVDYAQATGFGDPSDV